MTSYHPSAMTKEIKEFIDSLLLCSDYSDRVPLRVVDATLGDGGHSEIFLKSGCSVLGIDMDKKAIERAEKRLAKVFQNVDLSQGNLGNFESSFECFQSRHSQIKKMMEKIGWKKCDVVFADLGARLDQLYREDMSFNGSEEADMRFDKNENTLTASEILNSYNEPQLRKIFKESGIKSYRRISNVIVRNRNISSMPCNQLSKILFENGVKRIHPSTKVFMALRREVNKESQELDSLLNSMSEVIELGGIGIFLTWHSIEDRQVKSFYKKMERMGFGESVTKKPIQPSQLEIAKMPQVRSAKLRVFKFNKI